MKIKPELEVSDTQWCKGCRFYKWEAKKDSLDNLVVTRKFCSLYDKDVTDSKKLEQCVNDTVINYG